MTGSALLDLFLAMALFYFTLSLVCSSINDAIARMLQWRAKNLYAAVRSLLLNARVPALEPVTRLLQKDARTGQPVTTELVDQFFNHPFIQTLRLQADLERGWLLRNLDGLGSRLSQAWRALFGSSQDGAAQTHPALAPQTLLTAIPSPVFVQALIEVLKPAGWPENEPLTFAAVWRIIDQLPDDQAGPLKLVLKSIANDPGQNLETVRDKVAKWFDAGMAQASSWYRQRMQTTSLVVATVLCFALNIDSIGVANRFYNDSQLRAVYVAAADRLVPRGTPGNMPPAGGPPPPAEGNEAGTAPQSPPIPPVNLFADLEFGWRVTSLQDLGEQLRSGTKLMGLIITVVALGMGTPFWYDMLRKLVNKRREPERTP